MKPFTIRKATQPGKGVPVVHHDAAYPGSKYATAPVERGEDRFGNGVDGAPQDPNAQEFPFGDIPNLTQEEAAELLPRKTKVVNPWIYEQTHQEYLENITVSELSNFALSFFEIIIIWLRALIKFET